MRNLCRSLPAPLLAVLIPAFLSCSVIYPPIYQRTSSLSPRGEQGDSFSVGGGGTVSFGLEGLRIADASIFPTMPSGNTNAPSIMIGERCADFLRADA